PRARIQDADRPGHARALSRPRQPASLAGARARRHRAHLHRGRAGRLVEALMEVDVIIPARDQAAHIGAVLAAVPSRLVRSVVVVDNHSSDATARGAEDAGAIVVREGRIGYGAACLRGIAHLSSLPRKPDVVVFMSGSGSDDPREIPRLLEPLRE